MFSWTCAKADILFPFVLVILSHNQPLKTAVLRMNYIRPEEPLSAPSPKTILPPTRRSSRPSAVIFTTRLFYCGRRVDYFIGGQKLKRVD